MAHFGVLSYPGAGHLNPLFALSRQLVERGHRVTFFLPAEFEDLVRFQRLGFFAVNVSLEKRSLATPFYFSKRMAAIRNGVHDVAGTMEAFLRALPPILQDYDVEVLIVSEIALCGPTVAESLGLPYILVSTTLPHNFGWDAPATITPRAPWLIRLQKEWLEVSVLRMRGPVRHRLDRYRRNLGLGSIHDIAHSHPPLAHITQMPACVDSPRSSRPENVFYTGPFVDEANRRYIEFPWDRLDGRPLIYASLGTTRKGDVTIFHKICEACVGLNAQLALSLGGRRDPQAFQNLPGNPLVVGNAPQLELLKMASLVITHAGPNTVLEALMHGKPMVALPMVLDQPAIAARLVRLGAAEVLSSKHRSVEQIRSAILKVLNDSAYREAAEAVQYQICADQGLMRATDLVERVVVQYERQHVLAKAHA